MSFIGYELLPAFMLLIIPLSVQAGFFSKMAGMFTEEVSAQTELDTVNRSSVNTPLLSATKNPDPLKAVGGGDVFYEDGALVSTGPVGADEVHASKAGGGEISVYVVRERDTLSDIAEMYGVTTNTILWANDLQKATDIREGDSLTILPIVGVRHTIAKGETLDSIVKKFDANAQEVLNYNSLASADDLIVGKDIIIPGGELHQEVQTTKKVAAKGATPTKTTGKKVGAGNGKFINPAPGALRTQGIHGYNGVDLASKGGARIPIVAAASGQVIISKNSGWNGGYGNYIVIKHDNGTQTLYAHLTSSSVAVGDSVGQGETIGVMGNSGKSSGTHLHFEVRGGTNPF
jgi:murein DD-endopeptidase MepM/ murein hydrolase activator NlpD